MNTIKEKIVKVPVLDKDNFPYTTKEVRGRCAEVAQEYVDTLIAEIDELIVYNDGGDFDFIREKDLRESTNKYRSTK